MKEVTKNNIQFLIIAIFIGLSTIGFSQSITGSTTVQPNSTHVYSFNNGNKLAATWTVTGGSLVSTTSGGRGNPTYTATVLWGGSGNGSLTINNFGNLLSTLNNVTILGGGGSQNSNLSNENYVHNVTPRIATSNVTNLTDNEKIESVTYFDGLGRPMQQVGIRAGGSAEDIIIHMGYDEFGRQVKEFLPYSDTNYIASYRTNALNATNSHYDAAKYNDDFLGMTTADINPYSEKEIENSPLNRVMKQAAPGKDWKLGNNHEIEMDYDTNIGSEVRRYEVTLNFANNTYTPTLVLSGYYGINQLHKTITRDENHDGTATKNHTTEEFKNKQGQVVLKRTYNNNAAHDTYYVYDDYGNLTYVLPPKAEPQSAKPDATALSELCYQYKYDHLNRLVEKKIPGKGWEYIVYNKLDQPVMTQDANLRAQNRWLFTKYDAFGRVAYTGVFIHGITGRLYWQNHANLYNTQYESRINPGVIRRGTLIYYTSSAFPADYHEIQTINYYDNYTFDLEGGYSQPAYSILPISNPKGLATGSKVRVLGTNEWITSVSYYDDKARPIFVYSYNDYLKTTDIVKSDLTFDGRATETTTTHSKVGQLAITTIDKYEYDHANRLTAHKQKINNAALDEVITENNYDDLGQLESKGVGGKQNASARLQDVDYEYNVRGWLKTINDPSSLGTDLFGFKLNYNNKDHTGTKLYNGNIAETEWKTKKDNVLRWYGYEYDALNRIIEGDASSSDYDLTSVTYDKNGNIMNLVRRGHKVANPVAGNSSHFGKMDDLIYTYETKSNKLKKVLDNGYDFYGFKDGSNITTEYTYDANGNMLRDYNKGITSNISYNHLNLPTQVNISGGKIQYIYDATGVKQKKIVSTGTTTEYAGNHIYENGVLKLFSHPEGYVEPNNSNGFDYVYQYKDHLGNVRLTYADSDGNGSIDASSEIIEEKNYYPFGMTHSGYNNVVSANANSVAQKYGFGGKEEQDELGLEWLDFEARNYDPTLGRFMNVDPLASLDYAYSPYVYTLNNPILLSDPTGLSTHIDEDGNVVAVYDDGDTGVYTQTAETLKDFDPETMSLAITEDTQKIGETEFWDEFVNPETGKTMTDYRIQIGKSFDPIIAEKNAEAQDMDLIDIAMASRGGGDLDIKKDYKGVGALLNGKYATSRSAGNYLAGLNAEGGTFLGVGISFKTFQQLAGALHIEESNDRKLSKPQMVDIVLLGTYISPSDKSTFVAPTYGEVNYQYRQSKAGWEAGEKK